MRVFFNFAIVNPNELFLIGFYFGFYFLDFITVEKKKPDKITSCIGVRIDPIQFLNN
jgi:hypothetical protein